MSKISICVPCYNVERYIRQCLNSLICQTLEDIEIICVDDCSRDNTLNILEEYSEKHSNIKIVKHLQNRKLVQARKTAVAFANGEYLMFVDSDDYIAPYTCEKLYNIIKDRNVDIVEFDCKQVDINGNEINANKSYCNLVPGYLYNEEIFVKLADNSVGQMVWNKIYKKEIIQSIYLQSRIQNLYYKEDVFLTCIAYHCAKSYYGITDKLYYYRWHSGQSRVNVMSYDLFKDRCNCSQIGLDWMQIFYATTNLNVLETKVIKSKINNWIKNSNFIDLLKLKNISDFSEYLNIFIQKWGSEQLIDIIKSGIEGNVSDICYYQLRLLFDCLLILVKDSMSEEIISNVYYKNLRDQFYDCKKYDICNIISAIESK